MTLEKIYKSFKHGEDFEHYGMKKVYNALKKVGEYQVFIVEGETEKKLYNYVPEMDKFILLMKENYG